METKERENFVSVGRAWEILKKKWMVISIGATIGGLIALIVSFVFMVPKYSASSDILVNQKVDNTSVQYAVQQADLQAINTYKDILKKPIILDTVLKELKQKNSELEQSLRELENIKNQNETLTEYLNLSEKYGEYKTIPGYVINKEISNYSKTIVINIGKRDGVTENMTVIADKGLVGHVISVTETTAKVQTIVDTASSVSCSMSTTKDSIVCKGTLDEKSTLKAMYIPTESNIIQGDSIETSGLGGIYPKGIHVGTVKKATNTQNITDRYATIETAVDFDKLDTVLVIKN